MAARLPNFGRMALAIAFANAAFFYEAWMGADWALIVSLFCLDFFMMLGLSTAYLAIRLKGWTMKDIPQMSYVWGGGFFLFILLSTINLWGGAIVTKGALAVSAIIILSRLSGARNWEPPKKAPGDREASAEAMRYWHSFLGLFLPAATVFTVGILTLVAYMFGNMTGWAKLPSSPLEIFDRNFFAILVAAKTFAELYVARDRCEYERKMARGQLSGAG